MPTCQAWSFSPSWFISSITHNCWHFQNLSMDFIEGFPMSHGANVIMVVVDRLSKYPHFIPLKHPFNDAIVAQVFLDFVVKLHSVPFFIVSDRHKILPASYGRSSSKPWAPSCSSLQLIIPRWMGRPRGLLSVSGCFSDVLCMRIPKLGRNGFL
jgi:hypothetical protein